MILNLLCLELLDLSNLLISLVVKVHQQKFVIVDLSFAVIVNRLEYSLIIRVLKFNTNVLKPKYELF